MTNPGVDGTKETSWPSVSVIIPVRNEAEAVVRAIDCAVAQDYPGRLDIVIADGGSADGTRQAVESLMSRHDHITLVTNDAAITPAGLNAAIRASLGDVIVRCDAHSFLPPTYVRQAVETLIDTGADNVGGVQAAVGHRPVERAIAAAMTSPLGVGDARFHYGGAPGPVDTVYLGVFRRPVFDHVGLFDETLIRNQDYELNYRIRRAGGLVYFDPRLRVEYRPRSSLRSLWNQYWQYGRWKRRVAHNHPRSLRPRHLAPPALIIGLAGSLIAGLAVPTWLGLVAPAGYALVLAGSSVWAVFRYDDPALLLFGPAVAVMHVSWGLGFLTALK